MTVFNFSIAVLLLLLVRHFARSSDKHNMTDRHYRIVGVCGEYRIDKQLKLFGKLPIGYDTDIRFDPELFGGTYTWLLFDDVESVELWVADGDYSMCFKKLLNGTTFITFYRRLHIPE